MLSAPAFCSCRTAAAVNALVTEPNGEYGIRLRWQSSARVRQAVSLRVDEVAPLRELYRHAG
jgi:hypothetical protein